MWLEPSLRRGQVLTVMLRKGRGDDRQGPFGTLVLEASWGHHQELQGDEGIGAHRWASVTVGPMAKLLSKPACRSPWGGFTHSRP